MFVANEDLMLLSEERRIEFYERAHELGFEHVESASWNDPAGRNGYLIAYSVNTPGSESIYTWMPNAAPRATRFDPQHSWFDVSDQAQTAGRLYMRGANVKLVSDEPGEFTPIPETDADSGGYIGPKTIFLVDPELPGGAGGGRYGGSSVVLRAAQDENVCQVIFDRDPESVILRQNDVGELEIWTEEDGWQPYEPDVIGGSALTSALTPSAAGVFDDGALHLLPQSVSTDGRGRR